MTVFDTLHASCILVGEAGVLIRGPSGSGKSALARQIVAEMKGLGRFARLVCDDRVRLASRHGRLVATALPSVAGCIEVRGVGLLTIPYEPSAILRAVVDLTGDPPRLPEAADLEANLCGVALPRIEARMQPGLPQVILFWLGKIGDNLMTTP